MLKRDIRRDELPVLSIAGVYPIVQKNQYFGYNCIVAIISRKKEHCLNKTCCIFSILYCFNRLLTVFKENSYLQTNYYNHPFYHNVKLY